MARPADLLDFLWDSDLQQLMLMACPDAVVVTGPDDNIVLYSGTSEEIFGFSPADVLGRPIGILFGHRDTDRDLLDEVRIESTIANREVRAMRKGAPPFWATVSASALRDRYGASIGTVFYVRDHTKFREVQASLKASNLQLNEMLEKLHHVASHDGLTGLLNRSSAMSSAEAHFRASENVPFGVAVFDLDNFKLVNDTYGHMTGDDVLIRVARTIRDSARGDDIVGRFGGEEFIAFLPGADRNAAAAFAERTRAAVSNAPIVLESGELMAVTISAGVAGVPVDATHLNAAIMVADDRLYEAKRTGRNRIVASGDQASEGKHAA